MKTKKTKWDYAYELSKHPAWNGTKSIDELLRLFNYAALKSKIKEADDCLNYAKY